MSVEVQQTVVQQGFCDCQELRLQGGGDRLGLLVSQPAHERLSHEFEAEHQARGGLLERLDPLTHLGLRPLRVTGIQLRDSGGQPRQHPPVIEQWEAGRPTLEDVRGGALVRHQLAPGAEPGRADAVLIAGRQAEQVGRGQWVGQLDVGQRDPLDEHRHALDLELAGRAADALTQQQSRTELLVGHGREPARHPAVLLARRQLRPSVSFAARVTIRAPTSAGPDFAARWCRSRVRRGAAG